jgi:hypothetical protein
MDASSLLDSYGDVTKLDELYSFSRRLPNFAHGAQAWPALFDRADTAAPARFRRDRQRGTAAVRVLALYHI